MEVCEHSEENGDNFTLLRCHVVLNGYKKNKCLYLATQKRKRWGSVHWIIK